MENRPPPTSTGGQTISGQGPILGTLQPALRPDDVPPGPFTKAAVSLPRKSPLTSAFETMDMPHGQSRSFR
jgi:hypothetical protein